WNSARRASAPNCGMGLSSVIAPACGRADAGVAGIRLGRIRRGRRPRPTGIRPCPGRTWSRKDLVDAVQVAVGPGNSAGKGDQVRPGAEEIQTLYCNTCDARLVWRHDREC